MCFNLRRFLLKLVTPISKIAGHLHIAPHQRLILASDVFKLMLNLRKGDVVLTRSRGELTNFLIEGYYKHCALYVGNSTIIEAVGKGVRRISLYSFCASKDYICVCRPSFPDEDSIDEAVQFAIEREGTQYDYDFSPNEKAFYCAELVATAYKHATQGRSPFNYRKIMGIDTVLPIDFKNATDKFQTVLELPIEVKP